MVNSRRKGMSFESSIISELRHELGDCVDEPIKRILDQYREVDLPDVIVEPFAIECKRYARGGTFKQDWWDQVVASSKKARLMPALVYKFDRQPIQCVLPLYAINTDYPEKYECKAIVDWLDFIMIVRENIAARRA